MSDLENVDALIAEIETTMQRQEWMPALLGIRAAAALRDVQRVNTEQGATLAKLRKMMGQRELRVFEFSWDGPPEGVYSREATIKLIAALTLSPVTPTAATLDPNVCTVCGHHKVAGYLAMTHEKWLEFTEWHAGNRGIGNTPNEGAEHG